MASYVAGYIKNLWGTPVHSTSNSTTADEKATTALPPAPPPAVTRPAPAPMLAALQPPTYTVGELPGTRQKVEGFALLEVQEQVELAAYTELARFQRAHKNDALTLNNQQEILGRMMNAAHKVMRAPNGYIQQRNAFLVRHSDAKTALMVHVPWVIGDRKAKLDNALWGDVRYETLAGLVQAFDEHNQGVHNRLSTSFTQESGDPKHIAKVKAKAAELA